MTNPQPTHILSSRRIIAVLASAAAVLTLAAPPARAHDAMTFYPSRWTTTDVPTITDVIYQRAPSVTALSGSMKAAMTFGVSPWNQVGTSLQAGPGADLTVEPNSGDCLNGLNSLHYKPIDGAGSTLAVTWTCSTGPVPGGEPGQIVGFNIIFDSAENWYAGTGVPGATQYDLRGVSTHEFGHGLGFAAHFSEVSGQCSLAPRHTMCSSLAPGSADFRSLELHDKHTFDAAY